MIQHIFQILLTIKSWAINFPDLGKVWVAFTATYSLGFVYSDPHLAMSAEVVELSKSVLQSVGFLLACIYTGLKIRSSLKEHKKQPQ